MQLESDVVRWEHEGEGFVQLHLIVIQINSQVILSSSVWIYSAVVSLHYLCGKPHSTIKQKEQLKTIDHLKAETTEQTIQTKLLISDLQSFLQIQTLLNTEKYGCINEQI